MLSSFSSRVSFLGSLVSVLALGAVSSGCAGEDSVSPSVQLVDRTSQALSTGTLKYVNGTYSNCTSRTGNWSARISGTDITDPMTNDAVSVVKGDASCRLIVTDLAAAETYTAAPSITMLDSYAATASAFAAGANPTAFYGNAKLSALTYETGFVMSILFSDNVADANDETTAQYAAVASSVSESQVPAPDYSLTFAGFGTLTDIDDVVQTTSGTIVTTAGDQTGEFYVVSSNQTLGTSFADIAAEYAAGTPAALGAPLPSTAFGLEGSTLPTVRNLIMVHTVSNVNAYEVIRITFHAAP